MPRNCRLLQSIARSRLTRLHWLAETTVGLQNLVDFIRENGGHLGDLGINLILDHILGRAVFEIQVLTPFQKEALRMLFVEIFESDSDISELVSFLGQVSQCLDLLVPLIFLGF